MALVMARKWAGKPLLAIGLVPLLQCVVQSQGDCDRGFAVDFGGRDCHGRIRIRSARWPAFTKSVGPPRLQACTASAVVQHVEAQHASAVLAFSGRLSCFTTKTPHSLPSGSWTQVLSCTA